MQRRWPFWRTLIIALHCSGTEVERWIFCDALDSLPWEWLRPSKNGWKKRIELTSGWGHYRALDSAHKWGILQRLEQVRVQNKRKEVCQCRWRSRPWLSSRWAVEQVWWSQEPRSANPPASKNCEGSVITLLNSLNSDLYQLVKVVGQDAALRWFKPVHLSLTVRECNR